MRVLFISLADPDRLLAKCHEYIFVRSHFGEEVMGVEQGKKENRSEYGFYLTMKEFLDVRPR